MKVLTVVLLVLVCIGGAKAQAVYNVADYGVVGVSHGSTPSDESAAFLSLLSTVQSAGGGVIQFNTRKYRFDNCWQIPNDGAAVPDQPSLRITGMGDSPNGRNKPPSGGTVIDLRCNGTAKIDTRGTGRLELDHISFIDQGSSTAPFVLTTNTTLKIHHALFYGNVPNAPTQDAIILGGASLTADGSADSPFQGYGTVIENSYFNRIRRGVFGRTYANGVIVRDNTWWIECGGNAAIEFEGHITNSDAGNVITGNLIEMPHYVYGIKGSGLFQHNTVGPNNFYDSSATTQAFVRMESGAVFNLIIAGFHPDDHPFLSDATNGTQFVLTAHQQQPSTFAQPLYFSNAVHNVIGDGNPLFIAESPSGVQFYQQIFGSTLAWAYQNGGSAQQIIRLYPASATDMRLGILGSTNSVIYAETSDLRVHAANDKSVFIGTPNHPTQLAVTDSNITFNGGIAGGGTGLKHVRYAVGSISPLGTTDISVLWNGPAFGDTNYTVTSATIQDATGFLRVLGIKSLQTDRIIVTVQNIDVLVGHSGTLHVSALHD